MDHIDGRYETVIIQGNYHKTWKWRADNIDSIFTYYQKATLESAADPVEKTRVIIWPEYALVGDIVKHQTHYLEKIKELAVQTKSYIVTGTIVYEQGDEHFDSALIVSPDGQLVDRYDSVYPVYFNKHTSKGTEFTTITIGEKKFGFVICYEEMLPEVFDIYSEKEVDVIISLVNDMDLSGTPGMEFLLRYTQLRAAEHNVTILRSANTGYSVVIDNYGKILEGAPLDKQTWIRSDF